MGSIDETVRWYVAELNGDRSDDAYHAWLELGPAAVAPLMAAFRATSVRDVRRRLAQTVARCRCTDAVAALQGLLHDDDPEIWKTALDGLVTLGGDAPTRAAVLDVLSAAGTVATAEKREWIDDAAGQVRSPGARAAAPAFGAGRPVTRR